MKKRSLYIVTLSLIIGLISGPILKNKNYIMKSFAKEKDVAVLWSQEYGLKESIYTNNSMKIRYPQIVNINDKEKEEFINILIKNKAIFPYNDILNNLDKGSTYEVDGNYNIKLANDRILSIAYDSFNNVVPSAHPFNMFYATNIDMKTGKELTINNFICNFDDNFINKLKYAKYVGPIDKIYEKQIFDEVFRYYSNNDELINAVKSAPFYITEESIGISLPVAHVFGDYANLEIKLTDL